MLDHWKRYRGVDLEKTVETASRVYSKILYAFDLISSAGKSYRLEHNSMKMSRKMLVVD